MLTNAAMYSLIAGVIGARVMYVLHYRVYEQGLLDIFAIWKGGLELLGGVITAIIFLLIYLRRQSRDMLTSLDILSVALFLGIAIGRIGCFLNGCCYGQITDAPTGVIFPYGSIAYESQVYPDPARNRDEPYLELPAQFYGWQTNQGWISAPEEGKFKAPLKPEKLLTPAEKELVSRQGPYHACPVHPTQLYSTTAHLLNCFLLYAFWTRLGSGSEKRCRKGVTFSVMFILYSIFRFAIEFVRDDNPYEIGTAFTISQLISVAMFAAGVIGIIYYSKRKT
jgi:phosphatidylglycerol:prolipoprotein diacylglycerol transferase